MLFDASRGQKKPRDAARSMPVNERAAWHTRATKLRDGSFRSICHPTYRGLADHINIDKGILEAMASGVCVAFWAPTTSRTCEEKPRESRNTSGSADTYT